MLGKRYKLEIWLEKTMIPLTFHNKENLYLLMFSLHSINSILLYIIWDVKYNQLLDVITPKEDN